MKPNKALQIKTSFDSFFTKWLLFLRPRHGMTNRQIVLAAQFLRVYHKLSKDISDPILLNNYILDVKTRKQIRNDLNLSLSIFNNLMRDLRNHHFFEDGKINPIYIPNIPKDGDFNHFTLMLYFDIQDDE